MADSKEAGPCEFCGSMTSLRCAQCKVAFFCSKEHQRAKWKAHKNFCKQYKVVENSKESYLVSSLKVPPGRIILGAKPIVIGPSGAKTVCLGCLLPLIYDVMSNQCSGCGWPVCDYKCEQAPMHRAECTALQEAGFRLNQEELHAGKTNWPKRFKSLGLWLTVLRCLLLPPSAVELFHDVKPKQTNFPLSTGPQVIRGELKLSQFTAKNIMSLGAKVLTCSYGVGAILDKFGVLKQRAAIAVYISDVPRFDHSCIPNVVAYDKNEGLLFVSLRQILKGERLSVCKIGPNSFLMGTYDRQQALLSRALYPCHCPRCLDPSESNLFLGALRCEKCRDGDKDALIIPKNTMHILECDWICRKCKAVTSVEKFRLIHQDLSRKCIVAKEIAKESSAKSLVKFINTNTAQKGILHENHQLILAAKDAYCQAWYQNFSQLASSGGTSIEYFHRYHDSLERLYAKFLNVKGQWLYYRNILVSSKSLSLDLTQGKISKEEALEMMSRKSEQFHKDCPFFQMIGNMFYLKTVSELHFIHQRILSM